MSSLWFTLEPARKDPEPLPRLHPEDLRAIVTAILVAPLQDPQKHYFPNVLAGARERADQIIEKRPA